jgi:hypothetical protein
VTFSDGTDRKETVTVSFIANYEIDPNEFDLRVQKPRKIRRQLLSAVIPGSGNIQETLASGDQALIEYRELVEEARSVGTGQSHSGADP